MPHWVGRNLAEVGEKQTGLYRMKKWKFLLPTRQQIVSEHHVSIGLEMHNSAGGQLSGAGVISTHHESVLGPLKGF